MPFTTARQRCLLERLRSISVSTAVASRDTVAINDEARRGDAEPRVDWRFEHWAYFEFDFVEPETCPDELQKSPEPGQEEAVSSDTFSQST